MRNCDNCITGRCPFCRGNAHRATKTEIGWEMRCQECGAMRTYWEGAWRWHRQEEATIVDRIDPDQTG